jgi:hypothetical protein|tara:strand:+ start:188 stop:1081 length:894 start_codon:yes stop_codon:yes gene_type:complete
MNEISTLDTSNYEAMAKAMGMSSLAVPTKEKTNSLARLRIHHTPLMGQTEVKGKMANVEVVSGGTYKLEIPDGETYYAESIAIRPFLQRFMYKRFVKGSDNTPNRFVKTIMADNLNIDLKDNDGKFNCGKPAGYIADFKALPEKMQDLIRQIKRTRVVFGVVEMVNPVDANGNSVDVDSTPFIWEVENRDAFKIVGEMFTKLNKIKRLPVQHYIKAGTEERKLPNGSSFYLPTAELDLSETLDIDNEAQENLSSFLAWVANYNEYIMGAWNENMQKHQSVDTETVDEFIDIDAEEFA